MSAIVARGRLLVGCVTWISLVAAASASAHKNHAAASPKPEAAASVAPSPEPDEQPAAPERAPQPLPIDPKTALASHPHNKVVHFPIALGAAGAILLLLSYRWPQFGPGARLLLVVGALSAWVAVRSGLAQEADLDGGGLDLWLERHENFGKWTAGALTLTAAVVLVKRARPLHWLFALLVLALLAVTSFLGGILAHPPL